MDIRFSTPDFNATEITVNAVSEAGKNLFGEMFGQGACSINLPKSKAFDFETFVIRKGLKVS